MATVGIKGLMHRDSIWSVFHWQILHHIDSLCTCNW